MIRAALSIALSLMLVLTSHSAGQARGGSRAVDQMVICSNSDTIVIYVDADGKPTYPSHLCPDCALHGINLVLGAAGMLGAAPVYSHHAAGGDHLLPGTWQRSASMARAPPSAV